MKLNLGCGTSKIDGYINIDCEIECQPNLVHDFTKAPLPFEDGSIEEVVMLHTIEHVQKKFHPIVLGETHRVLMPDGELILSFPEFRRCFEAWDSNKNDQREFWEATLFGRQLYESDYHVCAMDSQELSVLLKKIGFWEVVSRPEPGEIWNSFITCRKGRARQASYLDTLEWEMSEYLLIQRDSD